MNSIYEITDDDYVLRRVPTDPNYIKDDGSITSFAFRTRKGENGLSVDVEKLSSYEKATLGSNRFRLVKLNVGQIRHDINDGLDVIHDPLPDNTAHALIKGKISRGKRSSLVKIAQEVLPS